MRGNVLEGSDRSLTCPLPVAEPHEICDEDNFGTMIWKETPAGEAAAVRCPRNATGEGDQDGVQAPVLTGLCVGRRWP